MTVKSINQKTRALEELSHVFEYPHEDYRARVTDWVCDHRDDFTSASDCLDKFDQAITPLSNDQLEEVFTRTFDMAPRCSPYISGHLYGEENFERGTLLTALNDRYSSVNFDTNGELPDHIALLLRFAPQMEQDEFEELVQYCLDKPLQEMESSLSDNPYQYAVQAVRQVLQVSSEAVTDD